MIPDTDEMVPRPKVAKEWNRNPRTIDRWERAKILGFDQPVVLNGRVYHRRSRLNLATQPQKMAGA
jgi:hypothetical protein